MFDVYDMKIEPPPPPHPNYILIVSERLFKLLFNMTVKLCSTIWIEIPHCLRMDVW